MSEREYESRLQSLKPFITLFLVVIGSALLASCGGGGSATTDSSTAAQSSEVPNATIQAVSGSATVPGTWTGRAPSRATRPLSGVVTRQITSTSLIKSETTGQSFVSGEVLVNLKSSSDWDAFSIFLASRKWTVVYYSDSLNSYTIKTDAQGEASLLQYVKQMNSLPYTYGVSKNRVNIGPQSISADPSWGADDSSWNMYAIKLPAARDLSAAASSMTPGFGVGVGLVDGNFSRFHEDITFRSIAVYGGNTLVTSDIQRGVRGSKEASDDSNHGMHVAGIIAANENTTGLVGVAPGVTVDAANPYASNGYATDEAVKSIFSQDLRNSRVINLSLGWKMCETAICSITKAEADQEVEQFSKAFIEFAAKVIDNSPHAKSVLFIQSSGNNGDITWKNSNELLTADYNGFFATAISYKFSDPELIFLQAKVASHVLIVGASTYSQASANYTMLPSHDTERSGLLAGAFILAPGGGSEKPIYSALLPSGGGRSRYGYMYGTSMAAPHVSGVAALVMQANPELSAQEVREVLLKAADNNLGTAYKDHPNAGDGYDGYRYLNAEAAVKMALAMKAQKNCGSITSPSVVAQQGPSYTVTAGQSTRFTATARPKDGYPFNSYRWKTSEGVEVLSTIEQANITFTTAGSGSVTVTPVLQDGTVCTLSAATSSVTVQGAGFTNPANGHSYELITCGTWSQCRVAAIAKGGSLVTIRNQAENDWLYATFGVPEPFWLGAYYDQTVGAWKWASGEPFQYSSWGNNLNNSGGDEFCSQTFVSTPGFWNDVRCNYPYSTKAIIEYPSGVALGGGTVTVLANTIPGATVTVPSGASSCSFVSTGTWSAGPQAPPQYQNADGVIGGTSYNLTNFGVPMPGEGNMALVVKHSSTGNWDLLGSSRTISVVAGETLSFMMNDATTFGYTDGNTGQLSTVWSCN